MSLSKTSVIPPLPNEIWYKIGAYLPGEVMAKLYAVNGVFYQLALDEKYREVWLNGISARLVALLEALSDPLLSNRVRQLRIEPSSLDRVFARGRTRPKTKTDAEALPTSTPKPSEALTKSSIVTNTRACHAIVNGVAFLHDIQLLVITWTALGKESNHIPYIDALWPVVTPSLHELRLHVSTNKLVHLLRSPIRFEHLRILDLELHRRSWDGAEEAARGLALLVHFMTKIEPSLEELSFLSPCDYSLADFFDDLPKFRALRRLTLGFASKSSLSAQTLDIADFVNKNSDSITSLSLLYKGAPNKHEKIQISLLLSLLEPKILRCLVLDLDLMPDKRLDAALVHRHSVALADLTSLSLPGLLSNTEIHGLVRLFSRTEHGGRLESLSIGTASLTRWLVDLLAENLPLLRSLSLEIQNVADESRNKVVPGARFPALGSPSKAFDPIHHFAAEIREGGYDHWALYDVSIIHRNCEEQPVLWGIMQLLAECVPSVQSFCGNGDMEVSGNTTSGYSCGISDQDLLRSMHLL